MAECYIDGTFASAKKGALRLVRQSAARAPRSWQSQTASLPVSVGIESASPHEIKLVDDAFENRFTKKKPELLIGDAAYDSDPEDERVRQKHRTLLVASHKKNRKKQQTQDGRTLWQNQTPLKWRFVLTPPAILFSTNKQAQLMQASVTTTQSY